MGVQTLLHRVLKRAGYLRPLKVPGYWPSKPRLLSQPFLGNSCVCVSNEQLTEERRGLGSGFWSSRRKGKMGIQNCQKGEGMTRC